MNQSLLLCLVGALVLAAPVIAAQPRAPGPLPLKRSNAELINGLLTSNPDVARLHQLGKRTGGNAELINSLLSYSGAPEELEKMGRRRRSNAELINGLNAMGSNQHDQLLKFGKRSNAELINGLNTMGDNYNNLARMGKRYNAELMNSILGSDTAIWAKMGRRSADKA